MSEIDAAGLEKEALKAISDLGVIIPELTRIQFEIVISSLRKVVAVRFPTPENPK